MNMQRQYEQLKVLSSIILSADECTSVVLQHDNNLEYNKQQDYRSVYIKDIRIDDVPNLKNSVISANENYYRLNLDYNISDCFFAK